MYGCDWKGVVVLLILVVKLLFIYVKDGILYIFFIVLVVFGKVLLVQENNLVGLLDGYFYYEEMVEGGQYFNVNVLNWEKLFDVIEYLEQYLNLMICVFGYVVCFNVLICEQQQDVIF